MLGGNPWRFRWAKAQHKGDKCWGITNHTEREIKVDPGAAAAGKERNTIIHEGLHAIFPFLNEECVTAAANEIDDLLTQTGYE